jgi:DNA-binding CsgD family transcriptional regulator
MPDLRLGAVDRWFEAYADRDVDALCAASDLRIEVVPVGPLLTKLPGVSFHGHRGLRTLADWSYEQYPQLRVEATLIRRIPGWVHASADYVVDDRETPVIRTRTETLVDVFNGRVRRMIAFRSESPAFVAKVAQPVLTPREREVYTLLASGLTAPEVAERLMLSPTTVRTHVQNGIARLGAETRLHALAIALERGEIAI